MDRADYISYIHLSLLVNPALRGGTPVVAVRCVCGVGRSTDSLSLSSHLTGEVGCGTSDPRPPQASSGLIRAELSACEGNEGGGGGGRSCEEGDWRRNELQLMTQSWGTGRL